MSRAVDEFTPADLRVINEALVLLITDEEDHVDSTDRNWARKAQRRIERAQEARRKVWEHPRWRGPEDGRSR